MLGHARLFRWIDRHGRHHEGGLVLPPDYDRTQRYPLVIQTHGFIADEFLVDGPEGYATAFAARALAGRGIVVLQVDEFSHEGPQRELRKRDVDDWESRAESPLAVAAYEAAIDALDAEGVIDRHCVGIIGFSRTGLYVQHMVTFSNYPIAAATIADSVAAAPSDYAFAYMHPPPSGMLEFERDRDLKCRPIVGAPLWGEGVTSWLKRSPYFHTDRVRTALRYKAIGTGFTSTHELFVLLKRQNKAVEMIQFPVESHRLQTPFARYASQQGNVDWFTFWLKGEEDGSPSKAEQYARWRILREQRARKESTGRVSAN